MLYYCPCRLKHTHSSSLLKKVLLSSPVYSKMTYHISFTLITSTGSSMRSRELFLLRCLSYETDSLNLYPNKLIPLSINQDPNQIYSVWLVNEYTIYQHRFRAYGLLTAIDNCQFHQVWMSTTETGLTAVFHFHSIAINIRYDGWRTKYHHITTM